jgi:hypothetical protein
MSSRGGTEQLNYYEILKLPKTATQEEIRGAFPPLFLFFIARHVFFFSVVWFVQYG